MSNREIKVSPDGNTVAIRNDIADENAWNAWGCINIPNGGHWASASQVADWGVVAEITPYTPPTVDEPPQPATEE